jgi:hypothetical protein
MFAKAAVFVGSDETIVSQISSVLEAFRWLLLQIGGANIAGADRALKSPTSSSFGDESVSPHSSSARHRARSGPRLSIEIGGT